MTFDTLGLSPASLRAVHDQGYLSPTPIQAQAIPLILDGRDLLAGAQTGTGKTAAFVLPMLERLHANRASGSRGVRALVVVPTRELALQVEQSVRTYGAHRPVRSTAIYGGVSMDRQVRALRGGVEIVVATPGRLLDHVRQGTVNLGHVEILVLDEADRMLDMGFIPDIRRILALLPTDRQSLLFSATFAAPIRRFAEDLLRDPASVDADRLAEQLGSDGINASAIHGNKSQSQRVRALGAFKEGRTQVLVATDIAARGLDIEALPHVVNFEPPIVPEDYVHRIGRTGRAGQEGMATSLVSGDEQELMAGIEKLLQRTIRREVVAGFEPSAADRAMAAALATARPGRRPQDGGARNRVSGGQGIGRPGQRPTGGRPPRGAERDGPSGPQHRAARRYGPGTPSGGPGGEQRWARQGPVTSPGSEVLRALPGERFGGSRAMGSRSIGHPQGGHAAAGSMTRTGRDPR